MFSLSGKSSKGGKGGKGSKKKGMGMGYRSPFATLGMVIVAIFAIFVSGAVAQETAPTTLVNSGTSAFVMATGWSEQPFQSFNGGIRAGITLPLDGQKGLFLRTAYQSLNFQGDQIQSLEVMPLLTWYVGNKWTFYLTGGLTGYVGGENTGFDGTGGFGIARRVWTQPQGDFLIPACIDLFAELTFTDAGGQPTGGLAQISAGIQIFKTGY